MRSGASPSTTTALSSSSSSSKGRRRGSPGAPFSTGARGYRAAFDGFDIATVAAYGDPDRERLHADARIIRNRAKIAAAIANARATLAVQAEQGSLDAFLWSFVKGESRRNAFLNLADLPAQTDESRTMSKTLRRYGFSFVGPTICYAFMQSAGLVNDHLTSCSRYGQV